LTYRELAPDSAEVEAMPALPAIKINRFTQGAVPLGVYRKEDLLGYVWFGKERYQEDEVRCTYSLKSPIDAVFDFDLVVLPAHRLGLGFAALWHCANQYLGERGVRTTFSRISRFNTASLRAHGRLGAVRLGTLLFIHAGAAQIMLGTVRPHFAAGIHRHSGPEVPLGTD
jgi:hypothetical protein